MKITFYSNFLTHHQLPFCLEMYKKYGEDFKFVSMEKINKERISLGYKDMDNDYPFVLKAYESKEEYDAVDYYDTYDTSSEIRNIKRLNVKYYDSYESRLDY